MKPRLLSTTIVLLATLLVGSVSAQDENPAEVFYPYLRGFAYGSGGVILWSNGVLYTALEEYDFSALCKKMSLRECGIEFSNLIGELANYVADVEKFRTSVASQAFLSGVRQRTEVIHETMKSLGSELGIKLIFVDDDNVVHPESGFWIDFARMWSSFAFAFIQGEDNHEVSERHGMNMTRVLLELASGQLDMPWQSGLP